jgi:signal transduction histidine kinase/tetratricopeptide (TPR) repeat protein
MGLMGYAQGPDSLFRQRMILGRQQQIGGHTEEALRLFGQAEQLAHHYSLYAELCEAKIKIGEVIYDHGNYDSALAYFMEAERLADVHELEPSRAYALYYIGKYQETRGNFKGASRYYDSALAICRKAGDAHLLVLILTSRGKNYISEGRMSLALQYYLEAFEGSEQIHDELLYAQTCSHLGSLYSLLNQYDKALEYDQKAFSRRGDLNNPEGIAKSCNNIGILFRKLKRNDSALVYFNQALDLCQKTGYKKGLVKALTNIGILYSDEDKEEKAFRYLDTAYLISMQAGFGYGIASSSLYLANLYRKGGQLSRALYYYKLSLSRLSSTDYDEMLQNVYQGLYECDSSRGDYRAALRYHVLLLETQKRLLNVENARELAVLNISFDLERKVKDNEVLRADNELKESLIKRKTTFIWLIVIALGFTCVLCLNIYNRLYAKKRANRTLEALNRTVTEQNGKLALLNGELETANREKDKLFSIISHELRNPLYWFQNLSEVLSKKFREMPADKVQKSLSALDESAKNAFHLMDNLLQWARSKLNRIHPKKGEHGLHALVADTAEMYQTIIQYKEIAFYNHIPGDCTIYADTDLLACVIRNLLSNAIKYTPAGGTIGIACSVAEDYITVAVRDSGSGMLQNEVGSVFSDVIVSAAGLMQEKGSGIGLKLCKEFVEINGGRIWAESVPGSGTCFFFTVPGRQYTPIDPLADNPALCKSLPVC